MCIILSCAPYARPNRDMLLNCWDANPDGAGLMYPDGTQWVRISKGYFDFEDYAAAIDDAPRDVPLVLHMRIGTSGGYGAGVTHPFPVFDDLDIIHATNSRATYALAHNGVLSGYKTDDDLGISDTVAFVRGFVQPLANSADIVNGGGLAVSNRAKKLLARASYGSRLAIMDYSGNVRLIGSGWRTVTKGIQASNDSFQRYRYTVAQLPAYDDYTDDLREYAIMDAMDSYGCAPCSMYGTCVQYGPQCAEIYDYADALADKYAEYADWETVCDSNSDQMALSI